MATKTVSEEGRKKKEKVSRSVETWVCLGAKTKRDNGVSRGNRPLEEYIHARSSATASDASEDEPRKAEEDRGRASLRSVS